MNGASSEGGETTDSIGDILGYLKKGAANGIAVNGILVWIDVQQYTTPPDVWQAQAAKAFCEDEIDIARSALWKAVGPRKNLIGDIIAHKSPNKKQKNLLDLHKAMSTLKERNALPLLLCSSPMVREFPAFHCDPENMTLADVVSKIKVVEDSLGAFIQQNSEQMQAIKDTISTSNAPLRPPRVRIVQNDLIDLADTPGSKKRKIGEQVEVDGISSIAPTTS